MFNVLLDAYWPLAARTRTISNVCVRSTGFGHKRTLYHVTLSVYLLLRFFPCCLLRIEIPTVMPIDGGPVMAVDAMHILLFNFFFLVSRYLQTV